MSAFIRGLRVSQIQRMGYGEVESTRVEKGRELVTVRLDRGDVAEYPAAELRALESSFRCDYCRRVKPDSQRRKVFGVSIPRSCAECLPLARRTVMQAAVKRGRS